MIATFPRLPDETLNAINMLGQWLAHDDADDKAQRADIVILAGNAVIPVIDAACELAARQKIPLLITGGIGHSTTFLYAAVARHPGYNAIRTTGRSEAAILADIARQFWQVPSDRLMTEEHSANCGENAAFTRRMLETQKLTPQRIVIAQDPTMLRRTLATFAREWRDAAWTPQWIGQPGIVPVLRNGERGVEFVSGNSGMWPIERYLSLLTGEVSRLRDGSEGYGPHGRDFIEHVDFPEQVLQAWRIVNQEPLLADVLRSRLLV